MSAVAKRYARALFSIGAEPDSIGVAAIGAELAQLADLFRAADLAPILAGGAIDAETRRRLVDRLARETGVSPIVANFLRVLADHQRLGELEGIEREYGRLSDRELGQVRAKVRSARPLAEADERAIADAFAKGTGRKVLTEVEVDPSLLGGVVVEIQGRVYDGSTRRELERLRARLAGD